LAGLLAIITWQNAFGYGPGKVDNSFKITAASGVHYDRNFVYFLYYLNLFPVVSNANTNCAADTQAGCWDTAGTPAAYNYDAAKEFLSKHGNTIQQDLGWTWYSGDRGKIYIYLFDAWLKGAPWNPSPTPASKFLFIFALSALYAACWWVRRPLVGALLVLLLGSNPFQIYEVYAHQNVFGFNISIAILLLALHVPLLQRWYRPDKNWVFLWPVGIGILMACFRTIRSEPTPMLLGAAGAYMLIASLTKKRRLAMVATLAIAFWITGQTWNWHFLRQQKHAAKVVASVGGHPFPEEPRLYHHVWHPIWCGLGDFDKKYGYVWNDHNAAAWAKPYLEAKGVFVPSGYFMGGGDPREFLDNERIYKKLPYDVPYYNDLIRDKVLGDIKKDPLWYLDILAKRVHRIFTMTTPVRLTWPTGFLNLPWKGFFLVPLGILLALTRSRFWLGLCLFTMPTATTALLVFSDLGVTYYGIFHIITCGVFVSILVSHGLYWGKRALKKYRVAESEPEPAAKVTATTAAAAEEPKADG